MKKWIIGILIIIVVFFALSYFLIPSTLVISNTVYCKATFPGASRCIMKKEFWPKWWIDKSFAAKNKFEYKGDNYQLSDVHISSVIVTINHNDNKTESEIRVLELVYDSVAINWAITIKTSMNPFKRINQYREAASLKTNTSDILKHLKAFIENDDNIYGIPIRLSSIDHIFILTTRTVFDHYPTEAETYKRINFLKDFGVKHGLKQTYYPMMNVIKNNDTSYRLMVGLPVDKETNFTDDVHSVRMVQGNFMVTEVKGGYKTISNALDQVQLYFQDYEKTAMAIPFEYLVTDRLNEPDTAKWITKIYAPVN